MMKRNFAEKNFLQNLFFAKNKHFDGKKSFENKLLSKKISKTKILLEKKFAKKISAKKFITEKNY